MFYYVFPGLSFLTAVFLIGTPDAEAVKVIEQAITAHGGKEKLQGLNLCRLVIKDLDTGEAMIAGQKFIRADVWCQTPNRMNYIIVFEHDGKTHRYQQLIREDGGWGVADGVVLAMDERTIRNSRESLYAEKLKTLSPLIEEKSFRLQYLGEGKTEGVLTTGVKISCDNHSDFDLFFSKDTHLLVGMITKEQLEGGKEGAILQLLNEYKSFHGLQYPTKMSRRKLDGGPTVTTLIEDFIPLLTIDESRFQKLD